MDEIVLRCKTSAREICINEAKGEDARRAFKAKIKAGLGLREELRTFSFYSLTYTLIYVHH